MPEIKLDRMAIDDVAPSPVALAVEIHLQLGQIPAPVPIFDIARALDILEISERPLSAFEAALLTDAERSCGWILLNQRSSVERRRYSAGHELGHFLCSWHETMDDSFRCTKRDMGSPSGDPVHARQEKEANRFAIELLAPKRLVAPFVVGLPDLERVLRMSERLEISKEAAARRYVELNRECLAVVFALHGKLIYLQKGNGFPFIAIDRGATLPSLPVVRADENLSEMDEVDIQDWLPGQNAGQMFAQVLPQQAGFSTVLLHYSATAEDEPEEPWSRG